MRKLVILAIGMLGYINVNAQTSLSVNGETLSQQGYNSSGTATTAENTDSVTVGSVMRYYVIPDASLNTSYTGVLTGTLSSSFTWTTSGATLSAAGTVSAVASYTAFYNYKEVTWAGPGTINLNVQEISANPAACPGSTTTIPVAVIAVPTATFGTDPSAVCATTPVQTFSLPLTLTTSVIDGYVRINYTVYNPDGTTLIAAQDLDINKSATTLPVTLSGATQYGKYYVKINSVTDRISRKGVTDVTGTIADNEIDLYVYKTPTTGTIYHISNK